jgi:hypothetical protein
VPVEGQWQRSRTPLTRRDKTLLACALVLAAAAAAVAALVLRDPKRDTSTPCVVVSLPATMGGATVRRCGSDARDFCRTQGPHDPLIAAACRKQNL